MFTRVTPSLMNNNLLSALDQTQQGLNQALTQVESQRRVNVPSDDPAAAALFSTTQATSSSITQYLQNITGLTGAFQVGDAALGSATSMMNQALTLGTEGGNSGLSNSDRQALAQQVSQIQQQMVAIGNTTYQGNYIFAGTANGPAYTANALSPDGVTYNGNTNVNQAEVAPGSKVPVNVPGSQIFQNASGSVFQALQDLHTALAANDQNATQLAVGKLNSAIGTLNQQRVFYGSSVKNLNSTQNFLSNEQLNLSTQQTALVGADLATAITNLSQAELARNAILGVGSKLSQISLLSINGGG
ncbi:MAG: flagellin [Terriglobales bacterium]